jgi:CheY-like chemotaxis protein
MRLLYLADDPHFAQLLHSELLSYRSVVWDLEHAVSLNEALGRLAEAHFDAVLLDMSLADSEGLDTLDITVPHAGETPILVIC